MIIVGCDYHPSFQQIAYVDTETGELKERLRGEPTVGKAKTIQRERNGVLA